MGVMNDIKVMAQQNHDLKKQARADKKAIKSLEAKVRKLETKVDALETENIRLLNSIFAPLQKTKGA